MHSSTTAAATSSPTTQATSAAFRRRNIHADEGTIISGAIHAICRAVPPAALPTPT
ncbi:hypothetical protein [Tunturiibacter psychrotolerans]|uniref:hypothetical protein n=1 Tax=Tunturiibacter psychrotolerans TaxID=3069686 RepID=UPI003D25AD92